MALEGCAVDVLGEDVGRVLRRRDVLRHDNLSVVELADVEVATKDVLRLGVVHRVLGDCDGTRAVNADGSSEEKRG